MLIENLFDIVINKNASDLHLIPFFHPSIRINGQLYYLTQFPILEPNSVETIIFSLIENNLKEKLLKNKELDCGINFKNVRFRVNFYYTLGNLACSFRLIPNQIKTIEELKLPSILNQLTKLKSGFILATGQTGEGKSTTLASIINEFNLNFNYHIITIEDPIEFVYPKAKSIISQRELGNDTLSWTNALKSALREDPDIILIGEIRDYETMRLALTLAETGHLVFSTLHTVSATQTIDRIINIFPSAQQQEVRTILSSTLKAIICQRLIPSEKYNTRFPACEILFNNSAVSNLIREGKSHLIDNIILTSQAESMILLEKSLFNLWKNGYISKEAAIGYAIRSREIKKFFENI